MSDPIAGHYRVQYANTQSLLLQQRGSKLKGLVTIGSYKGDQASAVDQFGPTTAKKRTGRFVPKTPANTPVARRWVRPEFYDWMDYIDSVDKLKAILDPQSAMMQGAVSAMSRAMDDEIIAGFFDDTALIGEKGTSLSSWTAFVAANAGHKVAVTIGGGGSNVGLNVAKLRAGKKALRKAEVDFDSEQVICVISADEHDSLLAEAQIVSKDFTDPADKPVLKEDRLTRFLGIDFAYSERLKYDASGFRRIPLYAKSGMHLGVWDDVKTDITLRTDLEGDPVQLSATGGFGATRTEEKKLVEILTYNP